jgi:hypothetical protein
MPVNRLKSVAGINIPDSTIANQATELLLEHGTAFIYNHSLRVFLFSSLNAKRKSLAHDSELLYVASVIHGLGLVPHYSSPDLRFVVDGAFPRDAFKKRIIPTFFKGFEHKTDTTFGNIKADVCAFMLPNFHRKNFCDCILYSPWSE